MWLRALRLAGVGVALACVWIGWQVFQAYQHLNAARAALTQQPFGQLAHLTVDDLAALPELLAVVQRESTDAVAAVNDPGYQLATRLPFVGDDLAAVATIATTVDDIAERVLAPLVDTVRTMDPLQPLIRDGGVDVAAVQLLSTLLQQADQAASSNLASLQAIDSSTLSSTVASAVTDLTSRLTAVQDLTSAGARYGALLAGMLGADGPRHYLVVFQNLAELRSTGGIFGSYAAITVSTDHGVARIVVTDQGSSSRTIGRFADPVLPTSPDQLAIYGANIATIPMDVNFTPDFSFAARSFAAMYQLRVDSSPLDGVISVDPVALASLLEGHDPVIYQGVELSSRTLVEVLLSTVYTMFPDDPNEQHRDAFLTGATAAAFAVLTEPSTDPRALVTALVSAVEQRRISVFSFHPEEQAAIVAAGGSGQLPVTDEPGSPTFGLFLNDRTYLGSKLGYYVDAAASLTATGCADDGSLLVAAAMTIQYDAPTSGLPEQVAGAGAGAYILTTQFRAFAPTGATVIAATADGVPVALVHGTDLGRDQASFMVHLTPGSSTAITVTFALPAGGPPDLEPQLFLTPGAREWQQSVSRLHHCG